MSLAQMHGRLQIPDSLRMQLGDFRRRLHAVKLVEAAGAATFVVMLAFLALYVADRLTDTPAWGRIALCFAAVAGLAILPIALRRWVWGSRTFEQLARILSRTEPRVGDRLLGVIELAHDEAEQARSMRLCEAAIEQVAEDVHGRDLRAAVPNPRHRLWAGLAAVPTVAALALLVATPAAAVNAWARLAAPWRSIARYTFARVEPLPGRLIVPHGEPVVVPIRLTSATKWKPETAVVRLTGHKPMVARLNDGRYEFALPPQITPARLDLRVGDVLQSVRVEPTFRPELTAVVADVTLPAYLRRSKPMHKDVRGGAIALVKGADARFGGVAGRDLASARVDGRPRTPQGPRFNGPQSRIDGSRTSEFRWVDVLGLEGKSPFTLNITAKDDEPPALSCEDLPRKRVVLDSELLAFKVKAIDDFGVRRVGIEWEGLEDPNLKTPAKGEKTLAAGGPEKDALDLRGTFSAKSLGIQPQAINLRVFAEDYLPGRPRVYSSTYTLIVMDPETHAIWLTEQLGKWQRQSLEVRDRELQLHETNKQLRALTSEELDRPEVRRRLENQAAAERANGRRLSNLVVSGEDLVKQATRNPEFGVGHLEKWAEMLQILKDISANRMPSVADLLKDAAQAPVAATPTNSGRRPMAGAVRDAGGKGKPSEVRPSKNKPANVPAIADRESSQQPKDDAESPPGSKKNPSTPTLRLPTTTLAGAKPPKTPAPDAPPALDEAIKQQEDLLAEFEKVAGELDRVMASLEGSTLVKRLKAASRAQLKVADRINDALGDSFGVAPPKKENGATKILAQMSEQEAKGSQVVSTIMDDMEAYFERRRYVKFRDVLDDMRKNDVIGGLRQLGDELKKETGVSVAQCEFWSDSLDRWAEDLVDPAQAGACPGCKSRGSLPPSIVLEVLQILEGEMNLREETRVTEQAKAAVLADDYRKSARKLSNDQDVLRDRTAKVIERIRDLNEGETLFAYEINLLGQVEEVMTQTVAILALPDTGPKAIGAETEAIELLLKSRRINPGRGGGGGASPGGGGGGDTNDSAIALLGRGINDKEVREDRGIGQTTGETGAALPEEFRAGLDEYFNRLENRQGGTP